MIPTTQKQWDWLNAYIETASYNATEACRQAGYKGTYESLRAIGYQNKKRFAVLLDARIRAKNQRIEAEIKAKREAYYEEQNRRNRERVAAYRQRKQAGLV